jgi:uncharacterized repeat protein (TIGR01451 family)|tara:strand:- start:1041 stop:3647 length:2607 start_codon:yes stop_codon:yes gene_type:complete
MRTKTILLALSLALFLPFLSYSQSVTVNVIQNMCFDDGSAEVILTDILEPVTVSWHNTATDDYYEGMNPTTLKDGGYTVTVIDPDGLEYITYTWIGSNVVWYPMDWPGSLAPCPGGTASVEILITQGMAGFDIYVNDELDGSTLDMTYETSPLPIGLHDIYILDANGCRSGYTNQETDSSQVEVIGFTDLLYELSYVETSCGVYAVSAELTNESVPPYVNYWTYWQDGEWIEEYSETLEGISSGTSVNYNSTDANGCEMSFNEYVFEPNMLQATGFSTPANCPNDDGAINMSVYGGTAPYVFEWSNGATTEDITGLAYGNYTLAVTDSEGCTNQFYKHVALASDVNVSGLATPPNCEENIPGDINISANGGVEPYIFEWSTGESIEDIQVDQFGYYSVNVTDAEGCVSGKSFYIPISNPCYSYVTGSSYYDLDGNCTENAEDFPMDSYVTSTNGSPLYYTGANSNYYRRFLSDVELTASASGYTLNCPAEDVSLEFVPNQTYTGVDFYLQPESLEDDLCVSGWGSNPVPGFSGYYHMYVSNPGTTVQNASVTLSYTTLIDFTFSTPAPSSIDEESGTVTWDLGTINPNSGSTIINIYFQTDSSVELGEEVTFLAEINGVISDVNPANNSSELVRIVVGSYDPNDKQVTPSGVGENNRIDPLTDELIYKVRFQNTGTAPAVNVVIQDEIDMNTLNIQTLEVLNTSHDLTDIMIDGNKVFFAFENIMLPDSTADLEGSQGYVSFKIRVNQGLALGTVIENDAAIYFDFNEPIITNTAMVTLDEESSIEEMSILELNIYPNPSNGLLNISSSVDVDNIQLLDVAGRVVFQTTINSKQAQVDIPSSVENGVYFLKLSGKDGITQTKKLVLKR